MQRSTAPKLSRAIQWDTDGGRVDVISGYVGTVELFQRAGFDRAAPTTGHSGGQPRFVMRKVLR